MKKRILAMLTVLVMLVCMVPVNALAVCNDCQNAPYVPGELLGSHFRKCEGCGNEFSGGSCTPDQHGFCTVCGALITHTCNSDVVEIKNNTHQYKCSFCGEYQGNRASHKYSGRPFVAISAEEHAKFCECGNQQTAKQHKFENGVCKDCGYKQDHKCSFEAGVTSNGNGKHTVKCECGQSVEISCMDNDGDGKCDSCGYQKYHTCNFDADITPNEKGSHRINCDCGKYVVFQCQDADGDNKCDSCAESMYEIPNVEHEHNYVTHSNNDGTHTTSCNCGGAVTINCMDYDGDNYCDSCGYRKYVHVCEGGAWTSNNDGTHSSKCSCGTVMDGPNPCQTINGKICYICGYNMHECDYDAGVTSNNNGTHNINCECGKFVAFTCLDNDGDGACDSCGYVKYVHECEGGAWTSNNDGTHSSKCSCGKLMDGPNACQTINGKTCYMCGYVMFKCDHKNMVTDVTKEPTCTEDGYKMSKCPDCGDTSEGKIFAKGHDFQNGKCTACGISNPDCQHPKGVEKYTPATCTDAGSHSFWCPECNFEKMEILPALEHMKVEKIEAATCTSEGKIHVVCRRCDELLLEKVLPVRDHVKIDKSYPATCTEDGLEHVVCSVCDQILRDEVIPAGHKFEDGHCTVCENACNHENGVEEEVAATCTSEGSHTFVCPDCNLEKKEVYPALGHVEKEKDQEPTCTQPGVHHVVCTRCNKLLVEKELPVVAHKYENGKCAVCGTSEPNYVEPSTPIDPIIPEEPEDTKTEEKNNWLTLDLFGFHIVGNAGK